MAFEIIAEGVGETPMGTFRPRADQSKYVSAFGYVSGGKRGWFDGHQLQGGIPTRDGKAVLRFREFQDEKKNFHVISAEGGQLREFIADRADSEAKDKYDGMLSNEKCAQYLVPTSVAPSNGNGGIGLSKAGTIENIGMHQTS